MALTRYAMEILIDPHLQPMAESNCMRIITVSCLHPGSQRMQLFVQLRTPACTALCVFCVSGGGTVQHTAQRDVDV